MSLKKKINISFFIILTVIFSFLFFILRPIFLEIKKSSEDLITIKGELVSLEKEIETLTEFKAGFQEMNPALEKINQMFISSDEPLAFLVFLENTSRDYGISSKISSAFMPEAKESLWPSISFQVTSSGAFPDFLKFLEKLESGIYPVEIQNLSINRLSENELKLKEFEGLSLGAVRADFLIKVYTK